MELSMEYQSNNVCTVAFSGTGRQPISSDSTLPDYCGDIERILHCGACIQLHTVNATADRLRAEGEIELRILYLTSDGAPDVFEQHIPLSVSLPTTELPQEPVITACASVDYLNCRALSPRKISLNGSVSVQFEVLQKKDEPLISAIADCEVLPQDIDVSEIVSLAHRTFDLSETLSLPADAPPVGKLIRTQAQPTIASAEAVENKLLLKGSLLVHVLYLDQSGTIQTLQHALPISQVLDAPGVKPDSLLALCVQQMSLYVQPKRDGADEMRLLDLAAKLSVTIRAFENKTLHAVADCYATGAALRPVTKLRSFAKYVKPLQLSMQQEESIESGLEDCEVLDAAILQIKPKTEADPDTIEVSADVTVLLLLKDREGSMQAVERSIELQLSEPLHLDADEVLFTPDVHAEVRGVHTDGGIIRLSLSLFAEGNIYAAQQTSVLIKVELLETQTQPDSQLILLFAKEGESLWPIAKRCRSTVTLIQNENDLSQDRLTEDRILLIPTAG